MSIITGRPSVIVDSCCSVPLPMPVTEEQISDQMEAAFRMRKRSSTSLIAASHAWSNGYIDPPHTPVGLGTPEANSGSFFKATVQLSIITQSVLNSLYTTSISLRSPTEIQNEMAQMSQRIDQWVLSLPREFNFQDPCNDGNMLFSRERVLLGFQLCGARMMLGRQCLRPPKHSWREGAEAAFARRMGDSCIEAAKTVVDTLADKPTVLFVYDQGPWWCIVHHVMQAVSAFFLGLSYPASTSQDGMQMMHYAKKSIRWLQTMEDPTAERAHQVAMSTLETVLRRYPVKVAHMWRMDFVHDSELSTKQLVDPNMTAYIPNQQYISQDAVMTPGYTNYDAAPNAQVFPAYQGAGVFSDNYHMSRSFR